MSREEPQRSEQVWSALVGFVLLTVLGPLLDWSTGDLLWGLLVTSLVTCLIAVVLGLISLWRLGWRKLLQDKNRHPSLYLIQIPILAFFGVVLLFACYGFHYFYALFIYFIFPLWPEIESAFDLTADQEQRILIEAAGRYWPFVIATLAMDWRNQIRPLTHPGLLDLIRPWALLLRMHLFIFAAILVLLVAGTGYLFYLLILLFFFFPWQTVYRCLVKHEHPRGDSRQAD